MAKFLKRPLAVLLCLLTLMSLFAVAVPTMAYIGQSPKDPGSGSTPPYASYAANCSVSIANYGKYSNAGSDTWSAERWWLNGNMGVCISPENRGVTPGSYTTTKYYYANDTDLAQIFYYSVPPMKKVAKGWDDRSDEKGFGQVNAPADQYPASGFWQAVPGYGGKQGGQLLADCLGANGVAPGNGSHGYTYEQLYVVAHYAMGIAFANGNTDTISSARASYKNAALAVYNWYKKNNPSVPNTIKFYAIMPTSSASDQAFMGWEYAMSRITIRKYLHPESNMAGIFKDVRRTNTTGYYDTYGAEFTFYSSPEDAIAGRSGRSTFKLEDRGSIGNSAFTQGSSLFYSPSTWYIKETKTPQGFNNSIAWLESDSTGVSISLVNKSPAIFKVTTVRSGEFGINLKIKEEPVSPPITLYKYDEQGNPLSGAKFELYYENLKGARTKLSVGGKSLFTTDSDGKILFEDSDKLFISGKYVAKEIAPPPGYLPDPSGTEKSLVLSENGDNKFIFTNPKATYDASLTIIKEPENPEFVEGNGCYSLSGAKFGVYSDTNTSMTNIPSRSDVISNADGRFTKIADLITDESGYARYGLESISKGSMYRIIELEPPKGYDLTEQVESAFFETDADFKDTAKNTFTFKDPAKGDPVELMVSKKGRSGVKISGATYEIAYYPEKLTADEVVDAVPLYKWAVMTDSSGNAGFNNIVSNYADGYLNEVPDAFVDTDVDTNGRITLPIGTVSIRELKAPKGWLLDKTVYTFDITGSGQTHTVDAGNVPTIIETEIPTTRLNVIKKWYDANNQDGFRPQSLKVTLHATYPGGENALPDILAYNPNIVTSLTLTGDGKADSWSGYIDGLPEGAYNDDNVYERYVYTLTEEAVNKYTPDTEEPELVKVSDTEYNIIFSNSHKPETTSYGFYKKWDDNNDAAGVRPEYAVFEVYSNSTSFPNRIEKREEWYNSATKVTKDITGADIGKNLDGSTNAEGVIYVTYDDYEYSSEVGRVLRYLHWVDNLPKYKDGKLLHYYAKEKEVSSNYTHDVLRDTIFGTLVEHSWTDSDTTFHPAIKLPISTFTNHIKTGSLTITKTDADGNGLAGAGFQVFKIVGNTRVPISATYNEEFNKYSYNPTGTEATTMMVSEDTGSLLLDNLTIGDYVLKETVTPDGYMPFEDEIAFSIKENKLDVSKDMKADKTVKNNKVVLPETGGIGDNWIYGIGVIALIGVVALSIILIVRKINKKEKKNHV